MKEANEEEEDEVTLIMAGGKLKLDLTEANASDLRQGSRSIAFAG